MVVLYHVFDPQILNRDVVVVAHDLRTDLVQCGAAGILHFGMQPREVNFYLAPPPASLFTAIKGALPSSHFFLRFLCNAWVGNMFARAKRRQMREAEVDPDAAVCGVL